MQFPPSVWGPFFWHTIHIIALGYPKNPTYTDKKCVKEFYESLAFLLPCTICKKHYREHLANNPLTPFLDSRKDILKWTIDIHNSVNKMLGRNTEDFHEAKVISMGKFKEEQNAKKLMKGSYE